MHAAEGEARGWEGGVRRLQKSTRGLVVLRVERKSWTRAPPRPSRLRSPASLIYIKAVAGGQSKGPEKVEDEVMLISRTQCVLPCFGGRGKRGRGGVKQKWCLIVRDTGNTKRKWPRSRRSRSTNRVAGQGKIIKNSWNLPVPRILDYFCCCCFVSEQQDSSLVFVIGEVRGIAAATRQHAVFSSWQKRTELWSNFFFLFFKPPSLFPGSDLYWRRRTNQSDHSIWLSALPCSWLENKKKSLRQH